MNAREFDPKLEISSETQFVSAEVLARPWLVHKCLHLVFASNHGYGYDSRSSPAPRHPCP